MKFSIITCTYNSERWIRRNIESVQNQIFKDFEHIFIDAFSTDKTLQIINEYYGDKQNNFKIFKTNPQGISHAMNEGIKNASGDYLIHLHSDDSFVDEYVLVDVDNFLNGKNLDWVYGQINVTEEDGKSLGIFPVRKIFRQQSKNKIGNYLLKFFNYIPHQAVFIKKDVFEKNGYFDTSLSSSMDPEMWLRIRKKTKWEFFDRVISNYCLRSTSESANIKNKEKNKKNYLIVQKRYLNFFEQLLAKFVNLLVELKNKNYR